MGPKIWIIIVKICKLGIAPSSFNYILSIAKTNLNSHQTCPNYFQFNLLSYFYILIFDYGYIF